MMIFSMPERPAVQDHSGIGANPEISKKLVSERLGSHHPP
jgi:hypothetical protein